MECRVGNVTNVCAGDRSLSPEYMRAICRDQVSVVRWPSMEPSAELIAYRDSIVYGQMLINQCLFARNTFFSAIDYKLFDSDFMSSSHDFVT